MRRDGDGDGFPEYYYYLGDDLHNVMAIVDSTGTVVERFEYGDYGQPVDPDPQSPNYLDAIAGPTTPGADPSTIGNPYLFNGRRFDPETGLYWYRTRYLDPIAGRFTSRDTIGIWGDPAELGNAYAYVGNNPWTFIDPNGMITSAGGVPGLLASGFSVAEIADILGITVKAAAIAVAAVAAKKAAEAAKRKAEQKARDDANPKAKPEPKPRSERRRYEPNKRGRKKQGRENDQKKKQGPNWKPRNPPKEPKRHTPSRKNCRPLIPVPAPRVPVPPVPMPTGPVG